MSKIQEKLRTMAANLLIADASAALPGQALTANIRSDTNPSQLLFFASWLALTDDARERELAYEIATRLLNLPGLEDRHIAACSEILVRLGNFPAHALTSHVHGSFEDVLSLRFAVENAAKRKENTITVGDRKIPLTDFQIRAERELQASRTVTAVSAPTSAGKSYLLCLDLVRRFLIGEIKYAAFVVPTRALSRQTAERIREEFRQSHIDDVAVRVLPPKDESDVPDRATFVFTQERLLSYLSETNLSLDVLFVDEAQGIADGGRGILLQQGIERSLARNPKCRVAIIAPMVRNPEAFGYLLGQSDSVSLPYSESLVTQNVFLVEPVPRIPKACLVHLKTGETWETLGQRTLKYNFRPNRKAETVAKFSLDITAEDDVTLVYSTGPNMAEKIAEAVARELPDRGDDMLDEFAGFVASEVHPDYPLVETLKKGVVFHYGMMPSIIRSRIEEMAESGAVRYIAATTTLLSGVNLPLKNLVIASPKKGSKQIMDGFEFWNLAGRAGRLGREYQGNIWILKLDKWEEEVYKQERQINVVSSFAETLRSRSESVLEVLTDPRAPLEEDNAVEAAAAKIFYDAVATERPFSESRFSELVSPGVVSQLDAEVLRLRGAVPLRVAQSAPGISPARTARLWSEMKRLRLADLVPMHPQRSGTYERLRNLMQLLQHTLMNDESQTYSYWTVFANKWIREIPLSEMIAEKIAWDRDNARKKVTVSDSIRDLLDTLERKIRFICARNFRVFAAAFQELCVEQRQLKLLASAAPVATYLDSGASSEETLHLMGLGFSRTSAIKIARTIPGQGEEGVARILGSADGRRRLAAQLPKICMEEVVRISGPNRVDRRG
jgi:hypothetical protein